MIEHRASWKSFVVAEGVSYPFDIPFFAPGDIVCYLADADGSNVRQLDTDEFAVATLADYSNGADITLAITPEPVGSILTVKRILLLEQQTALPAHGKLPSAALERALDKIVMLLQQYEGRYAGLSESTAGELSNLLSEHNLASGAHTGILAPLASPQLTGTPKTTQPEAADSSTRIATTAFVQVKHAAALEAAAAALEAAQGLGDESNALARAYETEWASYAAGDRITISHNLNMLFEDLRVRVLVKVTTDTSADANKWAAGKVIDFGWDVSGPSGGTGRGIMIFGDTSTVNSCQAQIGTDTRLFFMGADGAYYDKVDLADVQLKFIISKM